MSSLMAVRNMGAAPPTEGVTRAADTGAASRDRGGRDHARKRGRRRGSDTTKAEEANAPELRSPPPGEALRPGMFVDFLI
jgi:hypothetical protein